jgi:peptide-methionine (S)-S-oxide reductase
MRIAFVAAMLLLPLWTGCGQKADREAAASIESMSNNHIDERSDAMSDGQEEAVRTPSGVTDTVTLGAGCFWCIEAVFEQLDGVESVTAGYAGGKTENPSYEAVCSGSTGHAEVARIVFDTGALRLEELLDLFWRAHDPTTLNRQGADVGTQYRSAIFVHSEEQRRIAETSKRDIQQYFDRPVVTEITKLDRFWEAEDYHQDYFRKNRNAPYCQVVIAPKLRKLNLE